MKISALNEQTSTDPNSETPSDAGGVAARQGFKYQDHVAAQYALEMIENVVLDRVECETADDILLVWVEGSGEQFEYVQVKTTEAGSKWTKTEVLRRDGTGPTSLVEKSLLCDIHGPGSLFRIVSVRDVNTYLTPLKLKRDSRGGEKIDKIADDFGKKYKTTSTVGNDLSSWVENTFWEVAGGVDGLKARNLQKLARLADQNGANPTHTHCHKIYEDLLGWVDKAATASKVSEPEKKIIHRTEILSWWSEHLAETSAASKSSAKPYRIETRAFFFELNCGEKSSFDPSLTSYDVRYERRVWRAEELAAYLANWLPEIALKASELVGVDHLALREKFRSAVQRIEADSGLNPEHLLAEVLLHSVLRHYNQSEPIACKIFYKAGGGVKSFSNSHIVHGEKDELWLGKPVLAKADSFSDVVKKVMEGLVEALDTDFLKQEREAILTLREPQHLLATNLETALLSHAPIDDFIAVLCIPILIAYDSDVLGIGFSTDYREQLVAEVLEHYQRIKEALPGETEEVKVRVFLVPIESIDRLLALFSSQMKGV